MVTFLRSSQVAAGVASAGSGGSWVALKLAYDGRRFDGFARQPQKGVRTVEGELLRVLKGLGAFEGPQEAGLRPGSRTDRGVSARENVVVFSSRIPAERLPGAVVGQVPGLWPLGAVPVEPGFDPRWAKWREYRFFLVQDELPVGVRAGDLEEVMGVFVGRHDFSAFAKREPQRSPVREVLGVDVEPLREQGLVVVRVRGSSFLWQQVRRMVGAALAVARGEASVEELRNLLGDPSRSAPWPAASASRLVLWEVHDPRLRFGRSQRVGDRVREDVVADWGDAVTALRFLEGVQRSLEEDPGSGLGEKGDGRGREG